jgi:hypothetical protein
MDAIAELEQCPLHLRFEVCVFIPRNFPSLENVLKKLSNE